MPAAPSHELERLVALRSYGILDTPAEPEFDDIVQLAAHIFGVPIALISLVDDARQWFKARVGLSASEMHRDVAFCAHAILRPNEVLLVRDTTSDVRFADNPMVTGDPHIRFYAGVPLLTPERHALGALCVADREPRDVTTEQLNALRILGRQVTTRLELRKRIRDEAAAAAERHAAMVLHQAVVDNAGYALIATDATGLLTLFNPCAERMLGYLSKEMVGLQTPEVFHARDEVAARAVEFSDQLSIDLLPGFEVFVVKSRRNMPNEHDWTLIHKDGSRILVSLKITALRSENGEISGFFGIAHDLSAQRQAASALHQSEVRYQTMVDALSEGIVWQDSSGAIGAANRAAERILGLSLAQMQGRNSLDPCWRAVHEDETPYPGEHQPAMMVLQTGQAQRDVIMGVHKPDGTLTWLLVNAVPLLQASGSALQGVVTSFVDISAGKAVERALRESERFARAAMDGLSAHIAILDQNGAILAVNSASHHFAAANALVGIDPGHDAQANYLKVCDAACGPGADEAREMAGGIRKVISGAMSEYTLEYRCNSPTDDRWFSAHVTRFPGEGPLRLVVAHADITAQVRTRRTLEQLSERLSLALDAARIGIWEWDIACDRLVWDERMFELYGMALHPRSVPYSIWRDGLHPEDRARVDAEIAEAVSGIKSFDTEFRVVWPDGSVHHIRAIGRVQRDEAGRPTRMIGTKWDITDRKNTDDLLLASETRARAIIEAVADSIIVSDERGTIQSCNSATERVFGCTSAELLGRNMECLVPAGYRAAQEHFLAERRAGATELGRLELSGRRSDGSSFPIELAVTQTHGVDQKLHISLVRDITVRKQAEADLRQAKEQADAAREAADVANRAKSDFLANMSHELRTPLNGVLGMTHLLGKSSLDGEQRSFAEAARISGEALLALIDNVLDFSKVEAGKLELEATFFSLSTLLTNLAAILGERARGKLLQLRYEIDPAVPDLLHGDPVRLSQILTNLAGNAVKFTAAGEVVVRCELDPGGRPRHGVGAVGRPETVRLLFTVRDTGIGLSRSQIARLFVPFSQADSSTTREYGGTGLGLAIVKRLVECMDGTLGVESKLGCGSCFWFALALAVGDPDRAVEVESAPALAGPVSAAPNTRGRLLVAEDNPINQQVIRAMLEMYGYCVDVVESGTAAADAVFHRAYLLVLMDAQMPEMDGITATRRIRERESAEGNGRHTVIVALTANAIKGAREDCLAAGMDDYLSKPVTPDGLEAMLVRWLVMANPGGPSSATCAAPLIAEQNWLPEPT